jgi:hypothetical protein
VAGYQYLNGLSAQVRTDAVETRLFGAANEELEEER